MFTGTRGGAKPHLWVRSLDSPDARELEDTEGATQPAISPDGKWVAFLFHFEEVRKVRLSGGASIRLWTLPAFSASLTWASDDEILLELGAKTGIHRLSAGGGTAQELVPLDRAAGETIQRRPFVLRRERMVLYASTTADGRTTLAMVSLADGRRSRLEIEGVQALGMVDGRLVYARADGNLMAVPLDVGAMRVTGAAIELRERVAASGIGTRVALSEAGTLVYRAGSSTSRLMLVDENGRSEPIGTELGDFGLPRFSPDGRRIVVSTGEDRWGYSRGVARDLWLFDRDSGQATRLTRTGTASAPAWTPDGRRVVYAQEEPREGTGEIWTLPLDGSAEASRLAAVEGWLGWPVASPDGHSVIAVETRSTAPPQLIRLSLNGGNHVTPQLPASSQDAFRSPQQPRISPDGRLLAFSDNWEVYVRPLDGAGRLQVTDSGGSSPAWAPDSRHLCFGNGNVLVVAELRTTPTLAVVGRRIVTQLPYSCEDFDLAPDGKSFVVVVPASGRSDVLVAAHWRMIGTRLGLYQITAALGAGGMGEVYRATNTKLDRDVAIEVLPAALASDPDRLARFEREAKLLASLNHPNIAHVYGFESATPPEGSAVHFLAMELVEGEDLAERLKRGPIPLDEAIGLAKQMAEGTPFCRRKPMFAPFRACCSGKASIH